MIVDSADGVSSAFYLAARALLGQKDADINAYLALLRMPANTIGSVDTLFYVDSSCCLTKHHQTRCS